MTTRVGTGQTGTAARRRQLREIRIRRARGEPIEKIAAELSVPEAFVRSTVSYRPRR